MEPILLLLCKDALLAGTASWAFSICLGVPFRYSFLGGIVGALGHAIQTGLLSLHISLALSTFLGAFSIGLLSIVFTQLLWVPLVIFTVPGILPMIPGTFIFNTLSNLVNSTSMYASTPSSLALDAASNFTRAGVILCALAAGIALPNLLISYKKPQI